MAAAIAAVGIACTAGAKNPAEQALQLSVEGFDTFAGPWGDGMADTPECRTWQAEVDAVYRRLSLGVGADSSRTYSSTAEDGSARTVWIWVSDDSDGDLFDRAIPMLKQTFSGSPWIDCLGQSFGALQIAEIQPAATVARGDSWGLRLTYEDGTVYRYDGMVWQAGDRMVWLYTWGADDDRTLDWSRGVFREAGARLAYGDSPLSSRIP
jgi:hypothetical protein